MYNWIVLLLSCLHIHVAVSACPGNWLTVNTTNPVGQTCYRIYSTQALTFQGAASACQNVGGYLARDTSQNVHNALRPNIQTATTTRNTNYWFGLTDNNTNNGPWRWQGGPQLSGNFTAWQNRNPGQNTPNQRDCGFVSVGRTGGIGGNNNNADFRWQVTTRCNQTNPYICQRDSTAPPIVTTTARPSNCSQGWVGIPSLRWCIRLFTTPATWLTARQQCRSVNADLVRINSTTLNTFVINLIRQTQAVYWIGLNDQRREGRFVWLDDPTQANFTNWAAGMPNNANLNENCVVIDGFNLNYRWDDQSCNNTNRYICQRRPQGNGGYFTPNPGVPQPTNTNCGRGWEDVAGADTCVAFVTNVLSWLDALTACQSMGGDLASILNPQEESYILARMQNINADYLWIGANDRNTEGGWQWSDNSPFAYLNWDDRQPDNRRNSDCSVITKRNGRWNDVPCDSRNGYICKKKGSTTFTPAATTSTPPPILPMDAVWDCPRGWNDFRGSCYIAVQPASPVDQATAISLCSSPTMGGTLVSIIDQAENNFIFSLIPKSYNTSAWIGFQDPLENSFTWADGTVVQYTNWQPGQPNNQNNQDCVVMRAADGRWNDVQCSAAFNMYICKQSKSFQPRAGSEEEQGCTNGSIGYGAQCYTFVMDQKNFNDAQRDCRTRSKNLGNLATIDSGHLQAFLSAEIVNLPRPAYWIGLQQSNDVYRWQSNWPVSFTYWGRNHTGSERGTCVAMLVLGLWANYNCGQTNFSYICESPRSGYTTPTTRLPATNTLPCPKGWLPYGALCYQVFKVNVTDMNTWTVARDFCASQATGGSLLTVRDNTTQAWLLTTLIRSQNITGRFWIGLNDRDTEGKYVWSDSSPFLYSNWAQYQPNDGGSKEDCVEWVLPQNNWNDDYCYVSKSWICQVPRGSVITTPPTAPTAVTSSICPNSSWVFYKNRCYYVSPPRGDSSQATWFAARQTCMNMNADLVSIGGDDENGLITSLISKNPVYGFWIGLNDLDQSTYRWSDLSPVSYVNWAYNEPNDNFGGERCVEILSNGRWNDMQCQTPLGYVCEKYPGNRYTPTPYIPQPPVGGCPPGFTSLPTLSYCYSINGFTNSTRSNFSNAITSCGQRAPQATLASVHSSLEEKYVLVLLANVNSPAWIGLNDRRVRNKFEWVDNLAVTYTKWGQGQPDENLNDNSPQARRDCVDIEIRQNTGGWNDRRCSTPLAYVCEVRKDPSRPTQAPFAFGCHQGYTRNQNSCYMYYKDAYNFTYATAMCKADGGNLITLNNGIEQAFAEILTGHVNDSQRFWLGLKYDTVAASFGWSDGWPVRYTNWGHGEPNINTGQNCVTHMVDGQWQVANCSYKFPFICEITLATRPPNRSFIPGRCPAGASWFNYNGYCYHLETNSPKSWAAANAACSSLGAGLASIHSDTEARFLTQYLENSNLQQDIWIGLFKGQGSGFTWYDGTQLEYIYWAAGEPNDPESTLHQDCVKVRHNDGLWADTNCFDQNAYLCKTAQTSFRTTRARNTTGGPFRTRTRPSGFTGSRPSRPSGFTGGRPSGRPTRPSGYTGTRGTGRRTRPGAAAQGGSSSSSLSGGSIAGIVIGVLILVGLIAVIGVLVFRHNQGYPLPFQSGKQPLTPEEASGFDNASYSNSGGGKVNFSDA